MGQLVQAAPSGLNLLWALFALLIQEYQAALFLPSFLQGPEDQADQLGQILGPLALPSLLFCL